MKKSTALKEIDNLIKGYESDLEKIAKILPKTTKHKHLFNDLDYCLSNLRANIDMLSELKGEIEMSDKKKDEAKAEAFKLYSMPYETEEVLYDFNWDGEDKEEDED